MEKINIMINGLPGNVAKKMARFAVSDEKFNVIPFSLTGLDIEEKTEDIWRELLKDKDVVLMAGGNTFYLLKAVRESGFEKVIKELIEKGMVYAGSSAGSYVACPTIETATWKKPGEEKERFGVTDLTAMNLVPFLFKAHYDPEEKEMLKEKISEAKYETKILKDGQAILVEGDNYKLVSEWEEIKL